MPRTTALTVSTLLVALLACSLGDAATVSRTAPTVVPREPSSQDADLAAEWWRWAASSPEARNPVVDRTGEFCGENQAGSVWFLAGSFGEKLTRSCVIPADRTIFFPVVNCLGSSPCLPDVGYSSALAVLDGKPLAAVHPEPSWFQLTGVDGNPVVSGAAPMRAVVDGQWVRLAPLPAGAHTLSITVSGSGFSLDVTYALTVEGEAPAM